MTTMAQPNAPYAPYAQYHDTALWRALAGALTGLDAVAELAVAAAPDYVIGYLCQELAAKWVVASAALTRDR